MEPDAAAGPTDEDLMQRLCTGDDAALAALMARWEMPVKRFVFRLVGNAAETEDLAQETFVRVYTNCAGFRPGAKFSPWLFAIAANQAKNRLRWWRRRPVLSLEAWQETGGDAADPTAAGASAAEAAARRERIAEVRTAVLALPLDLRTALVLFEYEGQAMAEIAAALGCTPKAVENRLYRARQELRRRLRAEA